MTSFQIMSDLHLELLDEAEVDNVINTLIDCGANTLVLAGDIIDYSCIDRLEKLIDHFPGTKTIAYVLGNHEFWSPHSDMMFHFLVQLQKLEEKIDKLSVALDLATSVKEGSFLTAEHPGSIMVNNVDTNSILKYPTHDLAMGTLFFEMNPISEHYLTKWQESELIPCFESWIRIHSDHTKINLMYEINTHLQSKPLVVATHYLPHKNSIHPKFQNSLSNLFFLHDSFEAAFNSPNAPVLWIHGHTHNSCDYIVENTRVVCNPRGAKYAPNPNFDPALVIEV